MTDMQSDLRQPLLNLRESPFCEQCKNDADARLRHKTHPTELIQTGNSADASKEQTTFEAPMSSALRAVVALLGPLYLLCGSILAQNELCSRTQPISPSRPAVASAVDTTQCGVLEIEYGAELLGPGQAAHQFDFSGGLRFGITRDLDFHWFAGDFLSYTDLQGQRVGYGDNWLGLKYRFSKQSKFRPGLGVMYMAKIPTGDSRQGLSSGEVDHVLSLLMSKDVSRIHFDFNVIPRWMGSASSDVDRNVGLALASYLPVTKKFSLVFEPYGYTSLNVANPAYASIMSGALLQVHPRLYLDAGFDAGVTHGAQKRVYAGVTYAVANIYGWFRKENQNAVFASRSRE